MEETNLLRMFKSLLLVTVGKRDKLCLVPTEKEWNALFGICTKQAITGVCFSAIEKLPKEQRPPRELLIQWFGTVEIIEQQNKLMNERTKQALDFFRKAGFETTILKGQGMAALYPQPLRRQSGDIDVWVNSDRKRLYKFARSFDNEGKLYDLNYHHVNIHIFNDAETEVHLLPAFSNNPFVNRDLKKFFKKHSPNNSSDFADATFNLVFILFHCYEHAIGHGVGLRQTMDYYYVLCQGASNVEKKEALNWLKKLHIDRFASAMMWVLQELFQLDEDFLLIEPNANEGKFLLNEIMQGGNMGNYDSRSWGSLATPLSRFFYNLRRDFHLFPHYPHEVAWQPLFNIWHYLWKIKVDLQK